MNILLKIISPIIAVTALCSGCAATDSDSADKTNSFSFALIGDQQYNPAEELQFPHLLQAMDRENVQFVVHVGDFKAGRNAPCTDTLFLRRRQEFNESLHPFVYIPGDNDWVDCRRPTNGGAIPLERLEKLRELFFAKPESLGKNKLALTRQADVFSGDAVLSRYRENVMWIAGGKEQAGEQAGVVFATVNVQGSNDNMGFDADNDREQIERTRANLEWIKHAAKRASATDIVGLVIFLQANPGFDHSLADVKNSGFKDFLEGFEKQAVAFGKPILFAHGDTHVFRVDQPYKSPLDQRPIANVTRVECYGSPRVNWVRVSVNAKHRAQPFRIQSGNFVPVAAMH